MARAAAGLDALAAAREFGAAQLWAFDLPYACTLTLRLWSGDRPNAQVVALR